MFNDLLISGLKLPLKLLAGWLRGKPKKRKNELREKQLAHVHNFDPTRLNNQSWQKNFLKKPKKKGKKNKKFIKSVNKNHEK